MAPQITAIVLLAAGAVWAPLALGASGTWGRFGVEITMATAACLWASSGPRPVLLTAIPLLVAGSLLTQLVPVPESLLVNISPVSAGAWKVATAGLPSVSSRISLDPAATWTGIRSILIFVAATAAMVDMCRLQKHRRILMIAVAASGLLIILIGTIGGRIGDDQRMLGVIDLSGPFFPSQSPIILPSQSNGAGFADWVEVEGQRYNADAGFIGGCVGLFRYANHFAAAICLTLPALFSVWLWGTENRLPIWMRWTVVGIGTAVAIWAVAHIASSRAGTGALMIALFIFVFLVAPIRWIRIAAGGAAALMGIAVVAFLVLIFLPTETVLSIVPEGFKKTIEALLIAGRAGPARVAVRAFAASPFLGTGLDTFRYVFPRFFNERDTLFYAHNEYAQLLAETGMLGGLWLSGLVWYLAPKAVRFWRDAPGQYRLLNAGPWAALVGIMVHSAFDWDVHLAANALLVSVIVGLCGSSVPAPKTATSSKDRMPEAIPRMLLVGCCVFAAALLFRDAISETVQRRLREATVADRLAGKDLKYPAANDQLTAAIAAGESMARWDSCDSSLMVLLGQAQLHLAARQLTDPDREVLLGRAERWFQRARLASAMCRGLPQPVAVNIKN